MQTCVADCAVKLNANRQVTGTMRGFDQFMNVVLDKAHDDKLDVELGMVVWPQHHVAVPARVCNAWSRRLLCT